jgi:hypothetical protein
MKHCRNILSLATVAVVLCGGQLHAQGRPRPYDLTVLDMVEKSKTSVPLGDNNRVNVVEDNGHKQQLPVTLEVVRYTCTFRKTNKLGVSKDSGDRSLFLYKMRSSDQSKAYEWHHWSQEVAGQFRLLTDRSGITRLAWVDLGGLFFADVSRRTNRQARLDAYLANPGALEPPGTVHLPFRRLLYEMGETTLYWGDSDQYDEIDTKDITKDDSGNWVVTVANPTSAKVRITYTFVSDKTTAFGWRLVR